MVRRVQLHDFNLAEKPWIRLYVVNKTSAGVKCQKLTSTLAEWSPSLLCQLREADLSRASRSCWFLKTARKVGTAGFQDRIGFEARKFSADSRTKAQLCISFQSFNENKDLETIVNSIVLSKPLGRVERFSFLSASSKVLPHLPLFGSSVKKELLRASDLFAASSGSAPLPAFGRSSASAPRSRCFKSIRLPRKRTLYTVLRSPHVDKKSREQFEMKMNKQAFIVETETPYIRSQLLRVLFQVQETPGVQCQVVVHYKTRIQLLNS